MTDNLQDKGSSTSDEKKNADTSIEKLSPEEKELKLMDLYHEINMIFKNAGTDGLSQKENEKLVFLNAQIDTLLDFHIGFSQVGNTADDPFDRVLDELEEHFSGIKDKTIYSREKNSVMLSKEQEAKYDALVKNIIDEVDDKF